jgi:hypothetical protein
MKSRTIKALKTAGSGFCAICVNADRHEPKNELERASNLLRSMKKMHSAAFNNVIEQP